MDRDRRLSLTVGGLVLASLAGLAVAILSLSAQEGVWKPRYALVAYFDNVQGLKASDQVWLAGKRVGRVSSVVFGAVAPGRPAVAVTLRIDRDVQERIRSDSLATIGSQGVLGDRIVEIALGTPEGEVLPEGGEVPTQSPVDLNLMISRGSQALGDISSLTSNLNTALTEFREEDGSRQLAESVAGFGEIVTEVQEGEGLLHNLIYESYEGNTAESVQRSLATLQEILETIAHGEGLLHSIVYDAPSDQDIVLQALQAAAHLNSILDKVDRGEGSLGLLLNDPTLYEELKLLVGGANRSAIVRAMIRLTAESGE